MASFDKVAEKEFIERLVDYLCEDGSKDLRFFPAEQRLTIVSNLVARGRGWGFEWETNLALICDLMLSIAANMDQQPAIGAALRLAQDEDLEMRLAAIPPEAWDAAEATRQFAPAWLHPSLDGAEGWAPAHACLDVIAWDAADDARPALCDAAVSAVSRLGLQNTLDSFCVAALWVHLYGPERHNAPWLKDVLAPQMTAQARLEALRARIMLDHARRV